MAELDRFMKQNATIAKAEETANALMPSLSGALPHVKAIIIGCADMRVDPAQLLGLKSGEAVIMRNIGGRVTPGLLEQLGLLGRIGEVAKAIPGGGGEFNLIVLHHTDCGITKLADETAMLSGYFQINSSELHTKRILDPRAAIAEDVAVLRALPQLPPQWLLSGLVYDVATGLVEIVVPPAPIRD